MFGGNVNKRKYRLYHATTKKWKHQVGETIVVTQKEAVENVRFSGIRVCPEPIIPDLFPNMGRLTLLGFESRPIIIAVDAYVDVMPSGLSYEESCRWLSDQNGREAVYIPNGLNITRVMEAFLPLKSSLTKTGADYYTKLYGFAIPIGQYHLLSEEELKTK